MLFEGETHGAGERGPEGCAADYVGEDAGYGSGWSGLSVLSGEPGGHFGCCVGGIL